MKRSTAYSILILLLIFSLAFVNILYIRTESKYNYYKNKLSLLQQNNKNNIKNTNESVGYNDIIHLASKYNGEIKEFKNKNKNINAIISVPSNNNSLEKFLDEIKEEKTLKRISSISVDNKNFDLDSAMVDIDAEFTSKWYIIKT